MLVHFDGFGQMRIDENRWIKKLSPQTKATFTTNQVGVSQKKTPPNSCSFMLYTSSHIHEVKNGSLQYLSNISNIAIFHFHDYGRKSI